MAEGMGGCVEFLQELLLCKPQNIMVKKFEIFACCQPAAMHFTVATPTLTM